MTDSPNSRLPGEMDFDEFRIALLNLIGRDDLDGLRRLCEEQIIMPSLFVEKAIAEIRPGSGMNDLLFLMAKRLMEASPQQLLGFLPELERKKPFVNDPDGGSELVGLLAAAGIRVPEQMLRLVRGIVDGVDVEDTRTIDRMFADIVVIGPGFFEKYLKGIDLDPYSDRALFRIPLGEPPEVVEFEGRALTGKQRVLPLFHPEFESALKNYIGGTVRRATQEEGKLFYALVSFEIVDNSFYVIEGAGGRLAIYLHKGDRVHFIESLDWWRRED